MNIKVSKNVFVEKNKMSAIAKGILKKRYLMNGESSWSDVVERVVNAVITKSDHKELTKEMILNRYFIPNSPCLVNAGKAGGGLLACFVVPFEDTIEDIYKTKLDFALIARKGGGCGTSLSNLRPENSSVGGSTHGYAGGPVKFADTISHDMKALTQAGFREMAIMFTMSVYHPDIVKFITAKTEEGRIHNANISVVVDDNFMEKVIKEVDEEHLVRHKKWNNGNDGGLFKNIESGEVAALPRNDSSYIHSFTRFTPKDLFNLIIDGAWKNGEPGLLFYDRMNDSPYKHSNMEINATNPCGEQPLPYNGSCNLGSLDISKFLNDDKTINLELLELAVRLSIRFLDGVLDANSFPTDAIKEMSEKCRQVGLGIMGLADYYLERGIAYGSEKALEELSFIMGFIKSVADDESISMGEELGIPEYCKNLPIPRRNITLLSIAPTGTISLIAGCNSGIEPFFSEITERKDKTGKYILESSSDFPEHFRCAVSANGSREVTWREHVDTQAVAQKFVDSGVSKTVNFPNYIHKETVGKSFIYAWEAGCKGITTYRNGSRNLEVLSPKKVKNDKCPVCGNDLIKESGCSKCINLECGFSVCTVG